MFLYCIFSYRFDEEFTIYIYLCHNIFWQNRISVRKAIPCKEITLNIFIYSDVTTSRNICWLNHWLHQSDGLGSISPLRYICALLWHCSVFYLTINNCINHIISSTMAGHLELSTATPKPAAPPTQILCSRGSQTYPRKSCSVT